MHTDLYSELYSLIIKWNSANQNQKVLLSV